MEAGESLSTKSEELSVTTPLPTTSSLSMEPISQNAESTSLSFRERTTFIRTMTHPEMVEEITASARDHKPQVSVSIQRREPHLLTGRQMVQGIITKRQDRPLSTTVLQVKVYPPKTWTAIRVLKALPTISDRTNPQTNGSVSQ